MRSLTMRALMTAILALPAACVTINVYFPEAAAEKAAEQFVGKIIDSDAAQACLKQADALKQEVQVLADEIARAHDEIAALARELNETDLAWL